MVEINQTIFTAKKYCPLCNKEHELEKRIRLVKECKFSGRNVEYTDIYYYCKYRDYEIPESKELKEIV